MSGDVGQREARDVTGAASGDVMHVSAPFARREWEAVDPDVEPRSGDRVPRGSIAADNLHALNDVIRIVHVQTLRMLEARSIGFDDGRRQQVTHTDPSAVR